MRVCSVCFHTKSQSNADAKLSYAYVISHGCQSPKKVLQQINESNTMVPAFSQYCDTCAKITYIAPEESLQDTLVRFAGEKNDKVGLWRLKDKIIKNNSTSCA